MTRTASSPRPDTHRPKRDIAIHLKRAYEEPNPEDGARFLIDRLWARGVSKERLKLADWLKDLAPSTDLRRWFGHKEERWPEFEARYRAELAGNKEALAPLMAAARHGPLTLVYAAKDQEHNDAVVLKKVLEEALASDA
jgi:uncharacterized protein YeaO (DUF488 family)